MRSWDLGILVPLSPFVMVVCVVLIAYAFNYRTRKLRSQERLAAIEKGILLPEFDDQSGPRSAEQRAARSRRSSFILIGIAVGIGLSFVLLAWIERQRDILSAAALAIIPLAIGAAMLIDYRLQKRDLKAAQAAATLKLDEAEHPLGAHDLGPQ